LNIRLRRFWIFDMDGTLTVPAHDFDAIRAALGLLPGRPILEQLREIPEARARDLRGRLAEIELEIARRAAAQPGASELLEALAARGALTGILTRNSHANALETLARCGLARFFRPEWILGREACDPKPSPDGIRKLLEKWGASSKEAVMVGDYLFDLEAGREAGTLTVYVGPPKESGKNPWSDRADVQVADLHQLLRLVDAGEGSSRRLPRDDGEG
jgi:HAD superfamily hydrolase (TIGR01509 family)